MDGHVPDPDPAADLGAPLREFCEGAACFLAPAVGVPSRSQEVFYNPDAQLQRDIAVAVVAALEGVERVADPFTGSGVRAIRFLRELSPAPFVSLSDINPDAVALARSNLERNDIPRQRYRVEVNDASCALLGQLSADYVELDPYGSPAPFLDAACQRLRRGGVIGLTATDLAALSGLYADTCRRKYWARPLRTPFHRELGVRILIRRAQLAGTTHDRALTPVLVHSGRHYLRVYLQARGTPSEATRLLDHHRQLAYCPDCGMFEVSDETERDCPHCRRALKFAGPLWTGALWDTGLLARMRRQNRSDENLLDLLAEEATVPAVGFHDLSVVARRCRCNQPPLQTMIDRLRSDGYAAARTHFCATGLRANAPVEAVDDAMKKLRLGRR